MAAIAEGWSPSAIGMGVFLPYDLVKVRDTKTVAESRRFRSDTEGSSESVLQAALRVMVTQRAEVLARAARHCDSRAGRHGTTSEVMFRRLTARVLDCMERWLGSGDMRGFEAAVRALGHDLHGQGVPFLHLITSLRALEDGAVDVSDVGTARAARSSTSALMRRVVDQLVEAYAGPEATDVHDRVRPLATVTVDGLHRLVGRSAPMVRAREQIKLAAAGNGNVLLSGPTGTGKELAARAIHRLVGPEGRPFVTVNCAALPGELIESELFGHRKGAYTGADDAHLGLIRAAHGGTLLLDEITEMTTSTQAKLLRVLEERSIRPVGETCEIPVDVRFLATTNRDPERAVRAGALRVDVYHRLNVFQVEMPALCDHVDDVPMLAEHFANELAERGFRGVGGFDAEALLALQQYGWPGNVRELRNVVEVSVVRGKQPKVVREDIPAHVLRASIAPALVAPPPPDIPTVAEAESALIVRALAATKGNKRRAAQLLGISRHRLYDRLHELR